jgi:hypothetical protein
MTAPRHEPTPEEIRRECELIREGWDETRLAQNERVQPWLPPKGADPIMKKQGPAHKD